MPVHVLKEELNAPYRKDKLFSCVGIERYRFTAVKLALRQSSAENGVPFASCRDDSYANYSVIRANLSRNVQGEVSDLNRLQVHPRVIANLPRLPHVGQGEPVKVASCARLLQARVGLHRPGNVRG